MRYRPKIRIYLIADNLSAHKTPDIRQWAQNNNVELVFTPSYASFLNRIECHFWAIGEFVVNNADYPNWDTFKKAMGDHIHTATDLPRPTPAQGRTPPPDRRLTDEVSGATFLGDPLALGASSSAVQFADAMVLLLLAAAVVSFLGGESLGGVIIVSIVALNGGFGAFAEGRAQEALWVVRARCVRQRQQLSGTVDRVRSVAYAGADGAEAVRARNLSG